MLQSWHGEIESLCVGGKSMRSIVLAGLLSGCGAPCLEGFSKDPDGVCRADVPCEPGTARDPDLVCRGDDPEQPLATDTGVSEAEELDTGLADSDEADLPATEGPGRVRVVWTGLSGVPLHGVVVMATVEGESIPSAAMCVVVLQQEIDIDGFLVSYVPGADPCIPGGEPVELEPGPLRLDMQVVAGEGGVPVFCDERELVVAGDVTVDFSGVQSCDL